MYRVTIERSSDNRRFSRIFRAHNDDRLIGVVYRSLLNEVQDYYVVSIVRM